jgi:hypothetical protein
MSTYNLAQLNVGRAVAPMDHPQMAGFVGWLDEINALAERSPGFVWRLKGDNGNNTELKVTNDPQFIVNLSVWASVDALHAFTYASEHKTVFARRYDWFERRQTPNTVLWWQPAGIIPDIHEALGRLRRLSDLGPTAEAFTFKQRFAPPDATGQAPSDIDDTQVAGSI